MSARIGPFDTKVAILRGSTPTWHGFEQEVDPDQSLAAIAQLIGADYEVQVAPAQAVMINGEPVEILGGSRQVVTRLTAPCMDCPDPDLDAEIAQDAAAMFDDPDSEAMPTYRVLGSVGSDYQTIQNADLVSALDAFMDSTRAYVTEHPDCGLELPSFETMGTLDNRRRFWAMIKLGGFTVAIPGAQAGGQEAGGQEDSLDQIVAYLLVTTSHDGKSLASVSVVFVRVVCNNTLTAALDTEQRIFNIKHTGDVKVKVANVVSALDWLVKTMDNMASRFEAMVNSPMTDEEAELVIGYFFGAGARQSWLRDWALGLWSGEGLCGAELAPANTIWRFLQALTQTIEESQAGRDQLAAGGDEGMAATARVSGEWRGVKYTPTAATALCAGLVCDRERVMKAAAAEANKGKKGKTGDDESAEALEG